MAGELSSLTAKARELGMVFTPEQINLADELGDAIDDIKTAVKAAAMHIGAALAPVLIQLANVIKTVVVGVAAFAQQFPIATTVIAAFGVGLFAAATALIAFGTIAAVVIPTVTGLIAALDAVALPWIAIGVAIAAAVVELLAIGAVITAVAGYFLFFTQTGRQVLDTILSPLYAVLRRFHGLGEVFKKTFGGIGDALKSGDVQALWRIVLLGMTAAWHEFVATVLLGIAEIIDKLKALAKFGLLGPGAGGLLNLAGSVAREAGRGHKLDSALAQNRTCCGTPNRRPISR